MLDAHNYFPKFNGGKLTIEMAGCIKSGIFKTSSSVRRHTDNTSTARKHEKNAPFCAKVILSHPFGAKKVMPIKFKSIASGDVIMLGESGNR
jgi:hypothetical protein